MVETSNILSQDVIDNVKKDIEQASGQEVYFVGNFSKNSELIEEYNVLARGNKHMVPAILSDLKPGNLVVHNHPSGDLTPSANDIRIASRIGEKGIGFAIINNQVEDVYIVVEPRIPKEEEKLSSELILSIFKNEGDLSALLPDYEYREEQLSVVKKVINSFNEHQINFIEAGTGTGKSLAYLIPALYWSNLNNQPVVVSTNTINLQEQLINKDLVLLKKVLPFSFKSVLVKGRANYICRRKAKNLEQKAGEIFTKKPELKKELFRILSWLEETESGSRSDINFVVSKELWEKVASESEFCLKTRCPFFNSCFFMKARKEVHSADILIVNHHLLLSDANLKQENSNILPKYSNLIIDEAHNFNEIATYHLGTPFYYKAVGKFIDRLVESPFPLIHDLRNNINELDIGDKDVLFNIIDRKILPVVKQIEDMSGDYFSHLKDIITGDEEKKLRITEEIRDEENWQELLDSGDKLYGFFNKLGISLNKLYELLINEKESIIEKLDEKIIGLEAMINSCNRLLSALDFNLKTDRDEYVFWLEEENRYVSQKNAPLDISSLLPEILWNNKDNLILTSATLTVNNSFSFFKNSLGLKQSQDLKIQSPFNYSKQAKLVVVDDIPPASAGNFLREIEENFRQMLINTGGSTMVLFTSYRMLNYCVNKTENALNVEGINILPQGRYPRHYILEKFKDNKAQIIFGTVSFWEGVDVQGDDLRYLVIMKLPFPVPSEPVATARREKLNKEGRNSFYEYSLPRAVIRFRQGFGRLIRSRQDRGKVIVFDNRIIKKTYGRMFLKSLPSDCPILRKSLKEIKNI